MNKYLVIYEDNDGELMEPLISTAAAIFNTMDMSDCTGISIAGLYLIDGFRVVPCNFYGTWHNPMVPLMMKICKDNGEALDIGRGSDH